MNSSYYNGFQERIQGILIRKSLNFCYNKIIHPKQRKAGGSMTRTTTKDMTSGNIPRLILEFACH